MRKVMIVFGLFLLATVSTRAQEKRGVEVSGDYQYVRFNPGNGASGINCQGGSGSFGAYLTARLGVIGEFGACKVTGLPAGATAHEMDYLFGPRVYFHSHGRLFPFVQTLLGGERLSAGVTGVGSGSTSAFAWTAGGGVDATLTQHLTFRAVQVEYLYTHFGGASQNSFRLQSGIVYRFGR
ncbi:MAG TPA: outer membrane beta-barrel protein [Candidatus Acidoferrum sp.]|nr:outer membrane beta-barrel protein [Candidatus Acidoferrum sp.]